MPMKPPDGFTTPIWYQWGTAVPAFAEPPNGAWSTDVLVIGAGIAGLTTAYLLAKAGRQVVVLDDGPIASGQTGRTSAHLNRQADEGFYAVEKNGGANAAKIAYQSHAAAVDFIERLCADEGIDCSLKRLPLYIFGELQELEAERDAAQRAGNESVEIEIDPVPKAWTRRSPALRCDGQGKFDPLKYITGLAALAQRAGVRIQTGARVTAVTGANAKHEKRPTAVLGSADDCVEANAIVVATNWPGPLHWLELNFKLFPYRTYCVVFAVPEGAVEDVQYSDTGEPYHYCRLVAPDRLLVGGADHKVGQGPSDDPFAHLVAWGRETFPAAGEVVAQWSGQILETPDGLGYIGRSPTGEGLYMITGDSGMGLTHGTLGAMLVSDLIQGKSNPWQAAYDPARRRVTGELLKVGLNTSAQYLDLITGGEIADPSQVPIGEGAVIRRGLHKVAVYHGVDGVVREMSAVCTHLKCVVHWNTIEKSWDCPCHGSRFSADGKVVMGPATTDLPAVDE